MNLDDMAKYIIWIVFFAVVLIGLYSLLQNLGVI